MGMQKETSQLSEHPNKPLNTDLLCPSFSLIFFHKHRGRVGHNLSLDEQEAGQKDYEIIQL